MRLTATDLHQSVHNVCSQASLVSSYDPYGWLASGGAQSAFKGVWREQEPNLYLAGKGYRAYLPSLRRWTSPDTLSPFGAGGPSAYAYLAGDPVNHIDPDGRAPFRVVTLLFKTPRKLAVFKSNNARKVTVTPFKRGQAIDTSRVQHATVSMSTGVSPAREVAQGGVRPVEGVRNVQFQDAIVPRLQRPRARPIQSQFGGEVENTGGAPASLRARRIGIDARPLRLTLPIRDNA
jgi:RHS repeat-associated protein